MFERLNKTVVFPLALVLTATLWPSAAIPQDGREHGLAGHYFLYSGELGEEHPPTKKDTKISLRLSGGAATEMFQGMGATSAVDGCGSDASEIRVRRDLQCNRDRTTGRATCYFGIDLRSGKSVVGAIC